MENLLNSFNPSTTIRFDLPVQSNVSIRLFNILGQQVTEIMDKDIKAGIHKVNLNASNITTGVYIYTIKAQGVNGENFVKSKK